LQGVARRALGDHHAAEDVVQATFLLLARKARHISWQRSVGPWLYAAAVRFARKAIHRRSRYPESLATVPAVAANLPPDRPLLWQEVRTVLDEEPGPAARVAAGPAGALLPAGLTRDEAAPKLGWTLATLKRRLEKGRERLRGRLARRGLGLSALAGLLAGDEAVSASTVRTVIDAVYAGNLSTPAAALVSGGFARWQKLLAVALLVAVGAGGAWLTAFKPALGGQPADPPAVPNNPPLSRRPTRWAIRCRPGPSPALGTTRCGPAR